MARSSLLLSLIGAASLSAALMAGCGDNDAKPTSSAIGESCVRTSDCADGLTCIGNTCYKGKPPSSSSSGGAGGDNMLGTPVPPQLGGEVASRLLRGPRLFQSALHHPAHGDPPR
jgi:hypothetical protein